MLVFRAGGVNEILWPHLNNLKGFFITSSLHVQNASVIFFYVHKIATDKSDEDIFRFSFSVLFSG